MYKKESQERDFYDTYVYERLLPEKHILLDIKKTIDFSFVDEETKYLYSKTMGRPSFPPQVLFRILFLEFFYNLSDYDAEEQVKTNILFRYFAGLGISSPSPDNTTLAIFRKRLGEERFKKLFDAVVIQAKKQNLIKGDLKILDATHIQGNIALQGAVNLMRQGRKMIVKKISGAVKPSELTSLKETYVTDDKLKGQPTREQIHDEILKTKKLIVEIKGRVDKEEIKDLIDLLETSVGQQEGKLSDPDNRQPDEIISLSDEDARHGAKSKTKRFFGYKAHVSIDEGSDIITSAKTLNGNRNEGHRHEVKELLDDDKSKGVTQKAVAADSLYDSYYNRTEIHNRNMRAFIPGGYQGRNGNLKRFTYDNKNDTLVCPEGHMAISRYRQDNRDLFIFSRKQCAHCGQIEACPKLNNGRVRVNVSDNYRMYMVDNIPEKTGIYSKRKIVERKFGEGKLWHGLQRARYRKRARVAIQVFMTFLVLNIKRMVNLLLTAPENVLCAVNSG